MPDLVPVAVETRALRGASAVDLYARASSGADPFLLESCQRGRLGRYSFLGADPFLVLTIRDEGAEIARRDGGPERAPGGFAALRSLLAKYRAAPAADLPPLACGAVGFLSYHALHLFESIDARPADDLGFPAARFAFYDRVVAIDHERDVLHLLAVPTPEDDDVAAKLASLRAALARAPPRTDATGPARPTDVVPQMSRARFVEMVRRAKAWIREGDIYQANLAQRLSVPARDDPLAVYRRLRAVNPSPFAGLLSTREGALVSSSPERLVSLRGDLAETRPIAGTRPRGRTEAEDAALEAELRANEKERAEHVMLVDLARNDLGRVSRYGTVRVPERETVERYSHVMHLVSNVEGRLRDGLGAPELLAALFPGGTITGCPKIRAVEVVNALEPVARGPYTGSMGYVSFTGDADWNIVIRTAILARGRYHAYAGAGIVADSVPEREYEETLAKAQAMLLALEGRRTVEVRP
ncbi:MAG: anthranilate synthase component I family protein [Methanobacteriota archaeon]